MPTIEQLNELLRDPDIEQAAQQLDLPNVPDMQLPRLILAIIQEMSEDLYSDLELTGRRIEEIARQLRTDKSIYWHDVDGHHVRARTGEHITVHHVGGGQPAFHIGISTEDSDT